MAQMLLPIENDLGSLPNRCLNLRPRCFDQEFDSIQCLRADTLSLQSMKLASQSSQSTLDDDMRAERGC